MSSIDRLRALVLPLVADRGLELYDIEQSGGTLQILVSRPGGVDVGALSDLSRAVSRTLDEHDPIPGKYLLEVSSPGIDRPIQRKVDFERFRGFRAKLRLLEGPPRRRYTGVIGPVDGDELLISVDGVEHRIPLDLVESAHLVLTLAEYEKLAEGTS